MRVALNLVFALAAPAFAPAQVTVEFDNPWVHVSRVKLAAREKLPTRDYPDSVVVSITTGKTAFVNQGKQTVENDSDRPVEEILIELKPDAPKEEAQKVTLDPVKLDSKYHTVDFENDRVRILRTVLDPHIKSPLHQHPHYVVVYLTQLHTKMALKDGRVVDNVRRQGEVDWRDFMQHSTENVGDRRAMEIQVELK